jgi:hypothetical protein
MKSLTFDLHPVKKTYHNLKITKDVEKNANLVAISESCAECGLNITSTRLNSVK